MTYYDFECLNEKCHQRRSTVKHQINEPHPTNCSECGYPVRQIFHPAIALFKGPGFFSTDNKKDTRVRSESGALGRRVSETDSSNIDAETPTRVDNRGRPKMTPTRPLPQELKVKNGRS